MAEEVFSGGTKVFRYEKNYNVKADSELKSEIEKGYEEYYERKKRERKKKILVIAVFLLLIAIVLCYCLIK